MKITIIFDNGEEMDFTTVNDDFSEVLHLLNTFVSFYPNVSSFKVETLKKTKSK